MSVQPGQRGKHFTAFLLGLGLLLALTLVLVTQNATPTSGTDHPEEEDVPEMRLVIVEPADACVEDECFIGLGLPFTLGVEIVAAPDFDDIPSSYSVDCSAPDTPFCPPPGYVQAQTYVWFGPNITWDPASTSVADDIAWPDCFSALAVRFQAVSPNADDPPPVSEVLAHGCATGLFPPLPISTHVGLFSTMVLTCSPNDTRNLIQLLPDRSSIADSSGSLFTKPPIGALVIVPKLNNLRLFCGFPPTPTLTPTITPGGPTLTPTSTPTPTTTPTPTITPTTTPTASPTLSVLPCGDVNGDRQVNAEDALWLLWFSTDMIPSLPNPGDVNGDGVVDPLDALFVLWIELNLFRCL